MAVAKMFGPTQVVLRQMDITKCATDAVVNAANPLLLGGSGVDGAIHRVGGPAILKECQRIVAQIGRLAPGKAVITNGGRLPAKYVIHTVGPIWHGGQKKENEILRSAYQESLLLADKMALKSIAFPAISTGAYGFPIEAATEIALPAVKDYLLHTDTSLAEIVFALFSAADYEIYQTALDRI